MRATQGTAPDPDCPVCDDTGWTHADDDQGVRRAVRCTACEYWAKQWGVGRGVPDDEKGTVLASWGPKPLKAPAVYELTADNREALRQAQYFLDGVHPGLFIFGGVGCGKSALAAAIVNESCRRGVGSRFITVLEVANRMAPGGDGDALHGQLVRVPVLVLDDVGTSKGESDFVRRTLHDIYEQRNAAGKRTVFTSNFDLDELMEHFGNDRRLPSRIAGRCKLVPMDGPDYRLHKMRARNPELVGKRG
jgi:hypothetical protein